MDELREYFKSNGFITNKIAESMGIKRHTLAKLAKENKLERIRNGVYILADDIEDDFVMIQANQEKAAFSYHTALFLHGLSDRSPQIFHITVPQGYNASHIKARYPDVQIHYVKKEVFTLGLTKTKTSFANEVQVYDKERTSCDIVLHRDHMDKQIYTSTIIGYCKSEERDGPKLINYASILGIEDEIRTYLEVII